MTGILLTVIVGACRHVWNHMRADCEWRYAYACYKMPAKQDGAFGLDRNMGQATDSEGTVYALSDTDRLDARIARKQWALRRRQ